MYLSKGQVWTAKQELLPVSGCGVSSWLPAPAECAESSGPRRDFDLQGKPYSRAKWVGKLQCQQAFQQLGLEALGISVCLRMEKKLPLQRVSALRIS